MNIVIPMAGAGSRFANAGYAKPKPFIDVLGEPMIRRVIENLYCPNSQFILIAREEHIEKEVSLVSNIEQDYPARFVSVEELTEGTACTVLFARHLINNSDPLLIANSDQLIEHSIMDFVNSLYARSLDGLIMTFRDKSRNPKWSFAEVDENNLVCRVREKEPISENATVGVYLFREGQDFVDAAIQMLIEGDRVNGEYYTCPTYNFMIDKGKRVGVYEIAASAMNGLGTPEDLDLYLTSKRKGANQDGGENVVEFYE